MVTEGRESGTLSGGFSYTYPQNPTNLSPNITTLPGATSVTLSWTAAPGATMHGVRLSDNSGDNTPHYSGNNCSGVIAVCVNGWGATTFTATVVPGHSYTWWVQSASSCGSYGPQTPGATAHFSVSLPPTVLSIIPNNGTMAGGTSGTITGTNFRAGATVLIGGTAATIQSLTGTSIVATTGGFHACGVYNIVVTNSDGTSATLSYGYTYTTPPNPTNLSPNNATLPGATSVTLSWTAAPGATIYAVRLSDNSGDNTPHYSGNNCSGVIAVCVNGWGSTSFTATVVPGHSYTWWVQSGSSCGWYANQSAQATATFSVALIPLHAPTGLYKEASPSMSLVWTPPDNVTPADSVTYNLTLTGGTGYCSSGCLFHPGAPSWYTMGPSVGSGTFTWTLQAVSASRPYSGPVTGPPFTLP